ncbi:RNA polymerase sigma factor [Nocardioides flavescens]|uniref:Sigma-70 family RNA polymerase sigma factor n=1 Tax=Nocardioides flavescens TaxID=2691959 RepID=A0A6L7F2W7_9ACTN|nr:sigma-70 family RNA polymerase sigma factor [Nocardioides flavescens]MXG90224.1 sigma-70 family RNA polymerase sigma factor [Nocardioides flavescens]
MDDDPADERRLVDRARAGDPDAWELVYRRAYPRLIAYARHRLATHEQAEEAVSETMLRAIGSIARYERTDAGLQGWLFGIARNVVLETYRAGARQRTTDPAVLVTETAPAHTEPEAVAVQGEQSRLLARAFHRLSEADRDLLELRVLGGLGAEQVGALTGRRAGAVRMAQSRALARLRTEYEGLMA